MCGLAAGVASAATVWNPAANGLGPSDAGNWNDAANWTAGVPVAVAPGEIKAVFNVPNAAESLVTSSLTVNQIVQGDNNLGGLIRVTLGGSVATGEVWSAIGYNDTAQLIVESGGTFSFGQHAWIGFNPGGEGTIDIDGGVVNVASQLGMGWSGGNGFVNVNNDGLLALANIHPTDSIKQDSILNITGTGQVTIPGNHVSDFEYYRDNNFLVGNGIEGNVVIDTTTNDGFTTVTTGPIIPEPSTLGLLGALGVFGFLRRRRS